MIRSMSITDFQYYLNRVPEKLAEESVSALAVTRHGKRSLAVMQWEHYESMAKALGIPLEEAPPPARRSPRVIDRERSSQP